MFKLYYLMGKLKMIFHTPLPLDEKVQSGSRIRPIKMLNAFREIGYDVSVISGYGADRSLKIKSLKSRIVAGEKFEFMYSESSTQPTLLTEKHHYPLFPNLDFSFFKFCKKNGILIGLFYRDIHWRFPLYGEDVNFLKKNFAIFFYRYDLKKYSKYLDVLFLPSKEMARYLPQSFDMSIRELPPGHSIDQVSESYDVYQNLELFYVGGVGSIYQMHELFKVSKHKNVTIKFSTRQDEWRKVAHEYSNLNIVQKVSLFGNELQDQLKKTHIGLIFVKPIEYWTFVMPVKLFEYIGHGIPIIASEGTLTASFVKKHDIGWVIPYDSSSFDDLITYILNNRDEIIGKRKNILEIRKAHNWFSRAEKVVDCLV